MIGKLNWQALPFDQPIPFTAAVIVGLVLLAILIWVAAKGYIPYLWREWITSVDHKRIGVMYCILALIMLVRGFIDALMMRTQQAMAFHAPGFLPPEHYDQIFSAHGTIMIFFVAMPFMIGLMNFAVPLQLGMRDVAFPTFNSVGFWLTAAGALLVNISLIIGEFARTGWLPYPPLSELKYSPGVGVDYYLWAIQIAGAGSLIAGINLVTTILKTRAPGMNYMKMPIFCWTALASNLLIVAAFPILTAVTSMLLLDRYLDFHFFTNEAGGNPMMFMNLIWAWGHPEVYILILPAFGVFSSVIPTFSGKPLFGYRSMVTATMVICLLSFMVWLHHFFTMGAGGDVNGFFGIMTMIIAVPTGVKVFNWLFTMYGGRVRFTSSMLWALGFMVTFTIGGVTGVLMAIPPADFVLHNSLFLVAHFHNALIGGVLFGAFAGYTYWFPKAFGFSLDERLGKWAFWLWITGFYVAFMPLYVLGFLGMTRRMQHYDQPEWHSWLLVAGFGSLLILCGICFQAAQLTISIRTRDKRRDKTGDPWNGRTLEWATASPPPAYNFAVLPHVESAEAFWDMKREAHAHPYAATKAADYADIEIPRNSPTGFITAFFSVLTGFSLVWHIWWLVLIGLIGAYATFVVFAWSNREETRLSAKKLLEIDEISLPVQLKAMRQSDVPDLPPKQENEAAQAFSQAPGHGAGGPAKKSVVIGYGFWIFLISDIVMFAALFAAYAVLSGSIAGGPSATQIFNLQGVALETGCLLLSSFTCGMASLGVAKRSQLWTQAALIVTGLLGLGFILLELHEFSGLISQGAGPSRSAFLSAFFTLVGCHGLHITIGLLWLGTMMAQIFTKGFREDIRHRFLCFSLFWHALDIIWVGIFSLVYLMGALT